MKHKRNRRQKSGRSRVNLRNERKFILELEAFPLKPEGSRWKHKEKHLIRGLVLDLLPTLIYRFRKDGRSQYRCILLYDHYLALLNGLRLVDKKVPFQRSPYIQHRINRFYKAQGFWAEGLENLLI